MGGMLFLRFSLVWKNTSSLCLSWRWEDTDDSFCVGVGETQKGKVLFFLQKESHVRACNLSALSVALPFPFASRPQVLIKQVTFQQTSFFSLSWISVLTPSIKGLGVALSGRFPKEAAPVPKNLSPGEVQEIFSTLLTPLICYPAGCPVSKGL